MTVCFFICGPITITAYFVSYISINYTHIPLNFILVIGDGSLSILFLSTDCGKQWYRYAIICGVVYQNSSTTAGTLDHASNFTSVAENKMGRALSADGR
jgi:hypothetical protein